MIKKNQLIFFPEGPSTFTWSEVWFIISQMTIPFCAKGPQDDLQVSWFTRKIHKVQHIVILREWIPYIVINTFILRYLTRNFIKWNQQREKTFTVMSRGNQHKHSGVLAQRGQKANFISPAMNFGNTDKMLSTREVQ